MLRQPPGARMRLGGSMPSAIGLRISFAKTRGRELKTFCPMLRRDVGPNCSQNCYFLNAPTSVAAESPGRLRLLAETASTAAAERDSVANKLRSYLIGLDDLHRFGLSKQERKSAKERCGQEFRVGLEASGMQNILGEQMVAINRSRDLNSTIQFRFWPSTRCNELKYSLCVMIQSARKSNR